MTARASRRSRAAFRALTRGMLTALRRSGRLRRRRRTSFAGRSVRSSSIPLGDRLAELDQYPTERLRLEKGDAHAARPGHRRVAQRPYAAFGQLRERRFEVVHLEGHVLYARPVLLEVIGVGARLCARLDQLDQRLAAGEKRDLELVPVRLGVVEG